MGPTLGRGRGGGRRKQVLGGVSTVTWWNPSGQDGWSLVKTV